MESGTSTSSSTRTQRTKSRKQEVGSGKYPAFETRFATWEMLGNGEVTRYKIQVPRYVRRLRFREARGEGREARSL